MVGRGLCDGGGCLCVFFIPARHGAERTRSGAFLPPRRDRFFKSFFLLSPPFCRVDLNSNLSRQSRKEKKGQLSIDAPDRATYIVYISLRSVTFLGRSLWQRRGNKMLQLPSVGLYRFRWIHIRYLFVYSQTCFFFWVFVFFSRPALGWLGLFIINFQTFRSHHFASSRKQSVEVGRPNFVCVFTCVIETLYSL